MLTHQIDPIFFLAPRYLTLPLQTLASSVDNYTTEVRIALVGKYTGLQDSYLSVIKALQHASIMAGRKLVVEWIDATALEPGTKVRA